MAQTKNTAKKTAAAAKKPARDAYDDFLDLVQGSGAPKKASGSKSASVAKKKPQRAKKAKVEPGIGMPEEPVRSAKRASSDGGKTVASSANKRTGSKSSASSKKAPAAKKTAGAAKTSTSGKKTSSSKKTASAAKKTAGAKNTAVRKKRTVEDNPLQHRRSAVLLVENAPDPYDEPPELPARARRSGAVRRRRGGQKWGVTAALLACIACIAALGLWQQARYETFREMKAAVERQSFYEGTTVEGVDVSQMTLEQALAHWESEIEPGYAQRTVTLSNGAAFTAAQLGYTSDYAQVLQNAWSAGRSGSLEERYQMISTRRERPVHYTVARSLYSEAGVAACVKAVAEQIDRPVENAKVESFDTSSYAFTFTEAMSGKRLDQTAMAQDVVAALESGGGEVTLAVKEIQPETTAEEISSQYGMIASAVTNASSSSSNRLSNIKLAMQLINGTCIEPGETFSFNETVGKRTTERGFKLATAYSSGEVTEDVGGGICQVSTTLFNAAVKADLEIVERHNHSLTVSYVDKGKDAAVNWNSQDLRFTNNGDDKVYICCVLTSDKRVRVGVFGKKLANGETITIEAQETGSTPYETIYQASLSLMSGEMQVTQTGRQGYTAVAYKVRWDADGNRLSSELLCKSSYKKVDEIIEYGP